MSSLLIANVSIPCSCIYANIIFNIESIYKVQNSNLASTESKEDGGDSALENATDILSPSEVVKMRKKAHQSMVTNDASPTKEAPKDKPVSRKTKTIPKSNKNIKEKADGDKKKEKHKKDKVEGRSHDQKKLSKGMKEKRKSLKKVLCLKGKAVFILFSYVQ